LCATTTLSSFINEGFISIKYFLQEGNRGLPLYTRSNEDFRFSRKSAKLSPYTRRDWKIFLLSWFIGNAWWSIVVFSGLSILEWAWTWLKG